MLLNCGVGEDSWESLGLQGDQTSQFKGDQSLIFTKRTDPETEAPILLPPEMKSWLIGKYPDIGKSWRQEEKGMTEDEMIEWHHWLDGHQFEQALGVGEGQGSLVCYSPRGCKQSDTTEWLSNWTELNFIPAAGKWDEQKETIKLLEENTGKTRSDINHSRILYDPPPRILEIKAKINKWDIIKLKASAQQKKL